jgi:hypothetical protein
MPIDPNIFFQGAAIRAAKEKQIADTVGQIFQNYNAAKQRTADREAQKAADYEGAYMRVLTAMNSGVAPDPADLPKAQAFEQLRTSQMAVDQFGNMYSKSKPILGNVGGVMSQMGDTPTEYVSPYAAPEVMPTNSAMPPMPKGRSNVVNGLGGELAMPPLGGNYDEVSQASPDQRTMAREIQSPYGASQKTRHAAQEANIAIQAEGEKKKAALRAEAEFNQPIAKKKIADSIAGLSELNNTIDEAIKKVGYGTAGLGSLSGVVPGTTAADLEATLNTIQADAAFGALQTMRDNSPTGGALGAVSEKELALLMSAQAALQQSQSPGQLKANLKKYKQTRQDALERASKAYEEQYGEKLDLSNYGKSLQTTSGLKYKVVE